MCRFRLQCPRDKSDSGGGASPAALRPPGRLRSDPLYPGQLGLSRASPSLGAPTDTWCGGGEGSRKELTWGSFWNKGCPHSGNRFQE